MWIHKKKTVKYLKFGDRLIFSHGRGIVTCDIISISKTSMVATGGQGYSVVWNHESKKMVVHKHTNNGFENIDVYSVHVMNDVGKSVDILYEDGLCYSTNDGKVNVPVCVGDSLTLSHVLMNDSLYCDVIAVSDDFIVVVDIDDRSSVMMITKTGISKLSVHGDYIDSNLLRYKSGSAVVLIDQI